MVAQSNTRYIKTTDYRHYLWVSPAEDDKILCKFNFSLSGNMKLVDAIDKLPYVSVEEVHNLGSYNSYIVLSRDTCLQMACKKLAVDVPSLMQLHVRTSREINEEHKLIGVFRMTKDEMEAYLSFFKDKKIPIELRATPSMINDNDLIVEFIGPEHIDSWALVEYFVKNVE